MPRTYIAKTVPLSKDQVQNALAEVAAGASISAAARKWDMSKTTLTSYMGINLDNHPENLKQGRKRRFSDSQESEIVEAIVTLSTL